MIVSRTLDSPGVPHLIAAIKTRPDGINLIQLSQLIGRSKSYVANYLTILRVARIVDYVKFNESRTLWVAIEYHKALAKKGAAEAAKRNSESLARRRLANAKRMRDGAARKPLDADVDERPFRHAVVPAGAWVADHGPLVSSVFDLGRKQSRLQ